MSDLPKGFICECGTFHPFGMYVAAHWNELLDHTCSECGAKHSFYQGTVELVKQGTPKKVRPMANNPNERRDNDSNFINEVRSVLSDVVMYQDRKYSPEIVDLAMSINHAVDAVVKAIMSAKQEEANADN